MAINLISIYFFSEKRNKIQLSLSSLAINTNICILMLLNYVFLIQILHCFLYIISNLCIVYFYYSSMLLVFFELCCFVYAIFDTLRFFFFIWLLPTYFNLQIFTVFLLLPSNLHCCLFDCYSAFLFYLLTIICMFYLVYTSSWCFTLFYCVTLEYSQRLWSDLWFL